MQIERKLIGKKAKALLFVELLIVVKDVKLYRTVPRVANSRGAFLRLSTSSLGTLKLEFVVLLTRSEVGVATYRRTAD